MRLFCLLIFTLVFCSSSLVWAQPSQSGEGRDGKNRNLANKALTLDRLNQLKRTEHGERLFVVRHLEVLRTKLNQLESRMAKARSDGAWDEFSDLSADLQLMELDQRSLRMSLVNGSLDEGRSLVDVSDLRQELLGKRIFMLKKRIEGRSSSDFF